MADSDSPLVLATRGSPLALAQANTVLALCRAAFPGRTCELKILRTTGDKLQKASMASPAGSLPKGLFTKELEVALLKGGATLAVHSLKDLPTDLPAGLRLGAVLPRADARDVLIYRTERSGTGRGFAPHAKLSELPADAVIATSSTRRREQLLAVHSTFKVVEIRGNVGTRLQKIATQSELDATILAAAGLGRLGFRIDATGRLEGPTPGSAPEGLVAVLLDADEMIPAVGQAAIGIETRREDADADRVCSRLNHPETMEAVTAERAFLQAMGGGCQSPVAAYAVVKAGQLRIRAVSFRSGPGRHGELAGPAAEAASLGARLAEMLR